MKNYLSFCVAACFLFLFTQCSKDDSSPQPTTADYSPLTVGSTWTYSSTEGNLDSTTFTVTVENKDSAINGKNYKVLSSSDGVNRYMAKIGSDYYRFSSFPAIGVDGFEELYLKDNQTVNATWADTASFTFSGATLTANLNYTIKEKGVSHVTNGKTYNNVITVRLDLSLLGTVLGGGTFYYADGVGLIEDQITVTPPPLTGGSPYTSTQKLVSYEIK